MYPYPFSYFSSIFGFKKTFANRKLLSWFQLIFTSLFLISLSLIPVAIQNAARTSYPLSTFVDKVFDPLTQEVVDDIKQHVRIENQTLIYTGSQPRHENKAGTVLLGKQEKVEPGDVTTLYFDQKELIISQQKKELARISYQTLNQVALKDKDSLSAAISQDWFQQNRLLISFFLISVSALLFGLNFLILIGGASFFLYLTKKSQLFSFHTFKECYNFTLNCLGLPILVSLACGLFGQSLPTMITIQNILFVLYLVLVFYKTHFNDEN